MSKINFGVAKSCVTCANINYVKKGLKIHRVVGCDLHNEELGDEYIYKVCPDWKKGSSVSYEKLPVLENDHNLTEARKDCVICGENAVQGSNYCESCVSYIEEDQKWQNTILKKEQEAD